MLFLQTSTTPIAICMLTHIQDETLLSVPDEYYSIYVLLERRGSSNGCTAGPYIDERM